MIEYKEMALNMLTGLIIVIGLSAIVFAYGYLISLLNLSEIVETIVLFTPLVLYASYNMGALRRLNSKK